MGTITAIKKALEELREKIGIAHDQGENRLSNLASWCADLDVMRLTIESLQRENEENRELARAFAAESNQLLKVSSTNRQRADTAEERVRIIEDALTGLIICYADFKASSGNMEEAYYKLAKYAHPQWQIAIAALSRTGDTHGN